MAALAVYCKEKGYEVSGSDTEEEFPSDEVLANAGIHPQKKFDPNHIDQVNPSLLIYTGAHDGSMNSEVQRAIAKNIPVVPHGIALGDFMKGYRQISIAGCHGKTTTSAMIATILSCANLDPSYAIGSGIIDGLGLPGHCGRGIYFVAEADEYVTDPTFDKTPRFLWQSPELLVVTNIDFDHPDVFESIEEVKEAYFSFIRKLPSHGILILNNEDENTKTLDSVDCKAMRIGLSQNADFLISDVSFSPGVTRFSLTIKHKRHIKLILRVPGLHNVYNAAMAAAASSSLGVSWEDIERGLFLFQGARRRFDLIGTQTGVTYYDDYAHHPREIEATIAAARFWYPKKRIITIFQPHTYSRTRALLSDFARAFAKSDIAIFTDIYASAREEVDPEITGKLLASETMKTHPNVRFGKGYEDISLLLQNIRKDGDLVIFMGAGDIYSWGKKYVGANTVTQ